MQLSVSELREDGQKVLDPHSLPLLGLRKPQGQKLVCLRSCQEAVGLS